MKSQLFSIYDNQAKMFGKPFIEINQATASRACAKLVKESEEHNFHAKDFELYMIGTMDNETGELKSEVTKVLDFVTLVDLSMSEIH